MAKRLIKRSRAAASGAVGSNYSLYSELAALPKTDCDRLLDVALIQRGGDVLPSPDGTIVSPEATPESSSASGASVGASTQNQVDLLARLRGLGDEDFAKLEHMLYAAHETLDNRAQPTVVAPVAVATDFAPPGGSSEQSDSPHPDSHPAPSKPSEPPKKFGAYTRGEVIGVGGNGRVYRCRQDPPGRNVAIKFIHSDNVEHKTSELHEEAKRLGQLDYPGLVPVLDAGVVDGMAYFTMPLVEGGTLADLIRQKGCLDASLAAQILRSVASAVHYAHERGLVHCDLKPGNVLLDRNSPFVGDIGAPRVADFGVARAIVGGRSDVVGGTLEYMAPEQLRSPPATRRETDVYALGVLLIELLTGRRPLARFNHLGRERDDDELRRLRRQPQDLPELADERIPSELAAIILRCLRPMPRERYRTALEVAQELDRFLGGFPVRSQRLTLLDRIEKWRSREPLAAGGLIGALVLLVVLAVGSLIAANTFRRERDRSDELAELRRKQTVVRLVDDATDASDPKRTLARAVVLTAEANERERVAHRRATQRLRSGLLLQDQPMPIEIAKREYDGDFKFVMGPLRTRMVVYRIGSRQARIITPESGALHLTIDLPDSPKVVAFSPDDMLLAIATFSGQLRIWHVETGKPAADAVQLGGSPEHLAFTADSRVVVAAVAAGSESKSKLRFWSVGATEELASEVTLSGPPQAMKLAQKVDEYDDGQCLTNLAAATDSVVTVWSLSWFERPRDGKNVSLLKSAPPIPGLPKPDRKPSVQQLHQWEFPNAGRLEFDLHGRRLLAADRNANRAPAIWDTTNGKKFEQVLRTRLGSISDARLLPTGDVCLTAEGESLQVWNVSQAVEKSADYKPTRSIAVDAPLKSIDLSPDSQIACALTVQGTVHLIEWTTGRIVTSFARSSRSERVFFLGDGHQLATVGRRDIGPFNSPQTILRRASVVRLNERFDVERSLECTSPTGWFHASNRIPRGLITETSFSSSKTGKDWTFRVLDAASFKPNWQLRTRGDLLALSLVGEGESAFEFVAERRPTTELRPALNRCSVRRWDGKRPSEPVWSLELGSSSDFSGRTALSPDGKALAVFWVEQSWGKRGITSLSRLELIDALNGKRLATSQLAPGPVQDFSFSNDSRSLVAVCRSSTDRSESLVRWQFGEPMAEPLDVVARNFEIPEGFVASAIEPGTGRVAVGDSKGVVRLIDVAEGKELWARQAHDDFVTALAFTPDRRSIVSAGGDHAVRTLDAATGGGDAKITTDESVRFIEALSDGRLALYLGDLRHDRRSLLVAPSLSSDSIRELPRGAFAIVPSGDKGLNVLITAHTQTEATDVSIWDLSLIGQRPTEFKPPERGLSQFRDIRFTSPHEIATWRTNAALLGEQKVSHFQQWDSRTGEPVSRELRANGQIELWTRRPDGGISAIVSTVSPGKISGEAMRLVEWDGNGRQSAELPLRTNMMLGDAFEHLSPDGRFVLVTQPAGDGLKLHCWDRSSATPNDPVIVTCDAHAGEFTASIAMAEQGHRFCWAALNGFQTYRLPGFVAEGEFVPFVDRVGITRDFALNATGTLLAVAFGDVDTITGRANVYEVDGGRKRHSFAHADIVTDLDLRGELLATASDDQTACVWDLRSGKNLHRFEHDAKVAAVHLSPDATMLATIDAFARVRLWSLTDGQLLAPRWAHGGALTDVRFAPDSQRLVSYSALDAARILEIAPMPHKLEELSALAKIVDRIELDDVGRFVPLSDAKLEAVRNSLASNRTLQARLTPTNEARLNWHRREMSAAEAHEKFEAAIWHGKRISQLTSSVDWGHETRLAFLEAESGDYRAAVARIEKAQQVDVAPKAWLAMTALGWSLRLDPIDGQAIERVADQLVASGEVTRAAIWAQLGQAHSQAKRWSDAAKAWQKAAEADPENHTYRRAAADNLMRATQYVEAIQQYDRYLTALPDDSAAQYWRGIAKTRLKPPDRRGAIEDLRATERLEFKGLDEDNKFELFNQRAEMLAGLANDADDDAAATDLLKQAKDDFKAAAARGGERWRPWFRLGQVQLELNESATNAFDRSRQRFTGTPAEDADLELHHAFAQLRRGDLRPKELQDAMQRLRRCLELGRDDRAVRSNLGDALRLQAQFAAAVDEYSKALQFQSDDLWSTRQRIGCLVELNRFDEAFVDLQKLAKLDPVDPADLANLALVALWLERQKEYRAAVTSLMSLAGDQLFPLLVATRVAVIGGTPADAEIARLKTVAMKTPQFLDLPYLIPSRAAVAAIRAGKYEEGIKLTQAAIDASMAALNPPPGTNPKDEARFKAVREGVMLDGQGGQPYDWLCLAIALHHLGRSDEAKLWLDRARRGTRSRPTQLPDFDTSDSESGRDQFAENSARASMIRLHEQATDRHSWQRHLEEKILLRESTALLAPKP